jgi:spore germination protein GerM
VRPVRHALALGLVCLASVATSCGVPVESKPRVLSEDELPDGLRTAESAPDATDQQQEAIDLWFVRDENLASTRHSVPAPAGPSAAVDELLTGPSDTEQDESLRSAIPDPSAVVGVAVSGGVASVDITAAFSEIPASDQVLAVGQLVLTLTDLRGVGRVRFLVDDEQVAVPLPNGETSDDSVSRDDYLVLTQA